MEIFLVIGLFIGFGLLQTARTEKRIADIIEEDDQVIALFTYLLIQAKKAIPKTIANDELLEQIDMVIDDEDSEEDI